MKLMTTKNLKEAVQAAKAIGKPVILAPAIVFIKCECNASVIFETPNLRVIQCQDCGHKVEHWRGMN